MNWYYNMNPLLFFYSFLLIIVIANLIFFKSKVGHRFLNPEDYEDESTLAQQNGHPVQP